MPSRFSGVSKDHTHSLSSPLGLRTRTLWVAEMALAKCCFHTYTHMRRHTFIRTHMPDSSPRETWLLWRKSNQVAVTMETDLIGPFCLCKCPLTFSISGYNTATTRLRSALSAHLLQFKKDLIININDLSLDQ